MVDSVDPMTNTIANIPLHLLMLSLAPLAIVIWIQYRWSLDFKESIYAVVRMLGQLFLVGYVLVSIFTANSSWLILLVLLIMVLASSWISLRTIKSKRLVLLPTAIMSISLGGGSTLILITQIILQLDPWYRPQYMIPLAGMIFAYSMNAISLSAERYFDQTGRGVSPKIARTAAYQAGLIPVTNSYFSVGLVLLPGMMTGQILSGVDPVIAARYQIMVMAMVFTAGGLASAVFLYSVEKKQPDINSKKN
jgi:putative ABC transport system permease protein